MGPYKIDCVTNSNKKAATQQPKAAVIKLSQGQQALVNAAASLAARQGGDDHAVSRQAVMTACGYTKKKAGGFAVHLSTLKTKKQCPTYTSDSIMLTDVGRQLAEPVEIVANNEASLAQARDSLSGNKSKLLFDFLVQGGSPTRTRAEAATVLGYPSPKAGGFAVAMSQLASKDMMDYCIDEDGNPALRLKDALFPYGRGGENK
jgi:hypothetical protein